MAYTAQQIRDYIDTMSASGASDAQIRSEMDRYGVGPAQVELAYGVPYGTYQERYDAAFGPPVPGQSQPFASQVTSHLNQMAASGATDAQMRAEIDKWGIPPQQVADIYGIPRNQFQQRYDAATYTPQQIFQHLNAMVAAGTTDAAIKAEMDRYGVSPAQVEAAYGMPAGSLQAAYQSAGQPAAQMGPIDQVRSQDMLYRMTPEESAAFYRSSAAGTPAGGQLPLDQQLAPSKAERGPLPEGGRFIADGDDMRWLEDRLAPGATMPVGRYKVPLAEGGRFIAEGDDVRWLGDGSLTPPMMATASPIPRPAPVQASGSPILDALGYQTPAMGSMMMGPMGMAYRDRQNMGALGTPSAMTGPLGARFGMPPAPAPKVSGRTLDEILGDLRAMRGARTTRAAPTISPEDAALFSQGIA